MLNIKGKLNEEELNKRAEEVFDLPLTDYIYSVDVVNDEVLVNMEEVNEEGNIYDFDYKPDMTERPEALDYLLGLRNDFND